MLLRTACPLDCPDTCSLEVEVERDAASGAIRLVRVDAAPADETTNPFTQGWICKKVKHHADRVHGPDRVLTPLIRTGSKGTAAFRAARWDEALDLVAERVLDAADRHGAESVVPYLYNSSSGALARTALTPLLWRRFGASRVASTICAATSDAAITLTLGDDIPSADPHGVLDAQLVVIWGANPTVSNTHWPPLVAEARRRGASVVVIDPRRTGAAARADLHLAVRPGTDVVLALALAHRLHELDAFDETFVAAHLEGLDEYLSAAAVWPLDRAAAECGVEPAAIDELARLLAEHRPAYFRLGWGMERNRNGGSAWRAALALPALTGNFGRSGAGAYWSTSDAFPWEGSALAAAVLGEGADVPAPGRLLNQNLLGRDLTDVSLDPPVAVLFVQGANPAVMNPDQLAVLDGLARDDLFCVVHDQVLTDTARFADVVLPAVTHFEAADVTSSYGSHGTEHFVPVIDRVGESRTNDEVAAGLAVRFGYDPTAFDPDPARLLALAGHGAPEDPAAGWTALDPGPQQPERVRLVVDIPGVDRVPTYRPLDSPFPLTLLSPANPQTINSMFGERADVVPLLTMHPDDSAARGIADGDQVRVFDGRASIELPVRVDAAIRPGVVVLPKGLWRRATTTGWTANAFAPATLSDLAGGACFNDARVEVEPAP